MAPPQSSLTGDGAAAVGKTGGIGGVNSSSDNGKGSSSGSRPPAAAAAVASIAGFGGARRPTAAMAAAGLDTRDGFMVSCTLLLQRVLAICAIQRDFDRVVGATLSTLADGEATGSRESRRAGVEPAFAPAEAVLRRVCLLGEEKNGGGSSTGDKILSGQALVRLYLMRMLLEVVALPVAAASRGELVAAEGVYVGGVGSPCARQAQRAAEDVAAPMSGVTTKTGGEDGAGTQLERWFDGVPPVVDVVAADGSGLPSPFYVGRQRLFKAVCSKALRPDWFISMLEACQEEVSGRRQWLSLLGCCFSAVAVFFRIGCFGRRGDFAYVTIGMPQRCRKRFTKKCCVVFVRVFFNTRYGNISDGQWTKCTLQATQRAFTAVENMIKFILTKNAALSQKV